MESTPEVLRVPSLGLKTILYPSKVNLREIRVLPRKPKPSVILVMEENKQSEISQEVYPSWVFIPLFQKRTDSGYMYKPFINKWMYNYNESINTFEFNDTLRLFLFKIVEFLKSQKVAFKTQSVTDF
jgi:hypothetical protein